MEYDMASYQTTSNLNSNNSTQQIINVNQYTNQTYIINNISSDGMNYNSYYGWQNSPSTTGGFNDSSNLSNALMYNQSMQQTTSSIEDTLGSPNKDLIKTIYKFYQLNLNPIVLLKKDFLNKLTYNNYMNQHYHQESQYNSHNSIYSNDINCYYPNLNEIIEYFRFYLNKVICFFEYIPGKFLFQTKFKN